MLALAEEDRGQSLKPILLLVIMANLLCLAYYKYSTFFAQIYVHVAGVPVAWGAVVLPLSADSALRLVCMESRLKAVIESGAKDVYLPNDTHWGSIGAKLAAKAVTEYIVSAQ